MISCNHRRLSALMCEIVLLVEHRISLPCPHLYLQEKRHFVAGAK